ncbi:MAG: hypothetical protein LBD85_04195 [Oscillospiraceae bacterium]|jgi:hypothetical protein|nr:hypothetical protein [Oscillospiraceae bacterium]
MSLRDRLLWVILPIVGIAAFLIWLFLPIEIHGDPNILNVHPLPSASPADSAALEGLVELTPQNVQSVVASLSRPKSYSRTYSVTLYWDGDSSSETLNVTLSDNALTINGETFDAAEKNADEIDLLARIPTYENLLDVSPAEIRSADYISFDGGQYIRVRYNGLMYIHEYFISIESGLLEHALKRTNSGIIVYRMSLVK